MVLKTGLGEPQFSGLISTPGSPGLLGEMGESHCQHGDRKDGLTRDQRSESGLKVTSTELITKDSQGISGENSIMFSVRTCSVRCRWRTACDLEQNIQQPSGSAMLNANVMLVASSLFLCVPPV